MTRNAPPAADQGAPYLLKEMSGRVLWLTLNRAEKRNPLSLAMIDALKEALDAANADPQVRVIVLAALGPVFSAGHDLGEMVMGHAEDKSVDQRKASQREILTRCTEMMMTITHGAKPVIACVEGTATAGGCQLVATCDLALAADTARFCTPGVNIGAFCTTPLVSIGRKVGRKHAMELALTGDMFSAEEAFRFGLINRVVPAKQLRGEVEAMAQKIASKSGTGIRLGKKAFYQQIDMPIEEAYVFAIEEMIEAGTTPDAAEGTRAFFEKREPKWTDI